MPACIATGVIRFTCCQPLAVSLVKVTLANDVPLLLQRCAVWVPVLLGPL